MMLLLIFFSSFFSRPTATDYYFSQAGNDNTGTGGISAPFKTLAKLKALRASGTSGDKYLLRKGDVWNEPLRLNDIQFNTGTIDAYGIGNKPVITGFVTLSGWSDLGGNKYEASVSGGLARTGIVTIDGKPWPMGRYPNRDATNGGYLNYSSGSGSTTINTASTGTPNYAGGSYELVVRKNLFIMDRGPITSHSGGAISFTPGEGSGWGFDGTGTGYFIQNSYDLLDQNNEWFYATGPSRLDVYMTTNPATHVIKAAVIDTLAYVWGQNNLTIKNIRFEGSNIATLRINNCNTVTVQDCEIINNGLDGGRVFACTGVTWDNNLVENSQNNGVYFEAIQTSTITNSKFIASGMWPGMGNSNGLTHIGLVVGSISTGGNLVEYNRIDSTGYNGIHFAGNNVTIRRNRVDSVNVILSDGAAIYSSHSGEAESGRLITENILTNGIGGFYGSNLSQNLASNGIYMDDKSSNSTISNNTIVNFSEVGIFAHNSHEHNIVNNTIMYTKEGIRYQHDNIAPDDPVRNMVTKLNTIVSKPTQESFHYYSKDNDFNLTGYLDSNFYFRPGAEGTAHIFTNEQAGNNSYTLSAWKAARGKDLFTKLTPSGIISPDSIKIVFNEAKVLGQSNIGNQTWINSSGQGFTKTIPLAAYQSRLIIRKNLATATFRKRVKIVKQ